MTAATATHRHIPISGHVEVLYHPRTGVKNVGPMLRLEAGASMPLRLVVEVLGARRRTSAGGVGAEALSEGRAGPAGGGIRAVDKGLHLRGWHERCPMACIASKTL